MFVVLSKEHCFEESTGIYDSHLSTSISSQLVSKHPSASSQAHFIKLFGEYPTQSVFSLTSIHSLLTSIHESSSSYKQILYLEGNIIPVQLTGDVMSLHCACLKMHPSFPEFKTQIFSFSLKVAPVALIQVPSCNTHSSWRQKFTIIKIIKISYNLVHFFIIIKNNILLNIAQLYLL